MAPEKSTVVTDYNNPSHKQECTQRGDFIRSILVTGETEHQAISPLLIESLSRPQQRLAMMGTRG
jgi:hypothetical protein